MTRPLGSPAGRPIETDVAEAVRRSQDYFLRTQHADGYWWGELESNPTMEAECLLLTHFMGVGDPERWRKLANHILSVQRDDGTWGQYYGAPGDLSTSVECYFALKLAGIPADDPRMLTARAFILSKGGLAQTRVFTRIWLALFGQWDWRDVPTLPPEMVLLPSWVPMNLYDFASWARATMLPLSIVFARRPVCDLPPEAAIAELRALDSPTPAARRPARARIGVADAFQLGDRLLRLYSRSPWQPLRERAIRRAVEWIIEHQEADGSWSGIQPPWVYSLIALKTLGYGLDHPVIRRGLDGFDGFAVEEDDRLRVQACISPGWDTALAMVALEDSGLGADHPALRRAARWVIDRQIERGGDWQVKSQGVQPGGWAFEFANDAYPDIDDTAEVLIALHGVSLEDDRPRERAIRLGRDWLVAMQSRDGGWAAFDKDNTRTAITRIPFADFGEMIDPPSVDVTAHVLEALVRVGDPPESPHARRALRFILDEQEEDGAWFGRWGVNYVYGIGAVLPALEAVGWDMGRPEVRRAVSWLTAHQNEDGGWGETPASYADPSQRGRGPSTASQTAWALLGLMAADEWEHEATAGGLRFLVDTQRPDGTWDEPWFTGAGFPGYGIGKRLPAAPRPGGELHQGVELPAGFMINYHLYRNYWPLMALGRYHRRSSRPLTSRAADAPMHGVEWRRP